MGLSARPSAIRSFLIADIRGYTSFTAEHGDEAASRLAAKFAEVCGEGDRSVGWEPRRDTRRRSPGRFRLAAPGAPLRGRTARRLRRRDDTRSHAAARRRNWPCCRRSRAGRRRLSRRGSQPRGAAVCRLPAGERSSPAKSSCTSRAPCQTSSSSTWRPTELKGLKEQRRSGAIAASRCPRESRPRPQTPPRTMSSSRRCRPSSTRSCPSPAAGGPALAGAGTGGEPATELEGRDHLRTTRHR